MTYDVSIIKKLTLVALLHVPRSCSVYGGALRAICYFLLTLHFIITDFFKFGGFLGCTVYDFFGFETVYNVNKET